MRIFKKIIIVILVGTLGLSFFGCKKPQLKPTVSSTDSTAILKSKQKKAKRDVGRNELRFVSDTSVISHIALLNTTMGKIKIGLYGKDAPLAVENFVGLAKKGYFNGILFHRVAKNFLIQTGDGNTKYISKKAEWGKGGKSLSGEEFADELDVHTPSYKAGYLNGTLAMANRGPNSNTSQFFICLNEAKKLKKTSTIFGRVFEGLDVVQKISEVEITPGPFEQNDGSPKKPIKLLSVTITTINE